MRDGRVAKLVAAALVPVLLFGVGGAQAVPGTGGWPGLSVDWLREGMGWAPPAGSGGVVEEPSIAEVALPRRDPVPAGEPWPEVERVGELPSLNTETATFYELSDGRVQAEVSAAPVRYRDEDGELHAIDTEVVASDRAGIVFENRSNTFASAFGDSSAELARFELDGRRVSLGLPGEPVPVAPAADGGTVTFPGVLGGGADVAYRVTGTALKEQIVLPSPIRYRSSCLGTGGLSRAIARSWVHRAAARSPASGSTASSAGAGPRTRPRTAGDTP